MGKKDTTVFDWTDKEPFAIDRFEVQGYVNTHADFNVCHEQCTSSGCAPTGGKKCAAMVTGKGGGSATTKATKTTAKATQPPTTTKPKATKAPTTTTTKKTCPRGTWLPRGSSSCTKCTFLPSRTKTACGTDETVRGGCGGSVNTLSCKACACAGGKHANGVCSCPKGTFKTGSCTSGFACKSCVQNSQRCDPVLQRRTGVCGSATPPHNTWGCADCKIAGTSSAVCGNFQYRTGNCGKDKAFQCKDQPTCGAGKYYRPGATRNDMAQCTSCPSGKFVAQTRHRAPACKAHRAECGPEERMPTGSQGTATSDLKCTKNSACDSTEYEASPPQGNADRVCARISDCGPGTFVSVASDRTRDRKCGDCNGVTAFSADTNQPTCTDASMCTAPNQYVSVQATRTSDRKCAACPDGQEQLKAVPHSELSCTATTTTTKTATTTTTTTTSTTMTTTITTTTTSTTTTSTTTTTTTTATSAPTTSTSKELAPEVVAAALSIEQTLEQVQGQVQDCVEALSSKDGDGTYCATAEQCFASCDPLQVLSEAMAARLADVRAGTNPKTEPADANCVAYGKTICSTASSAVCGAYCSDAGDGDSGAAGGKGGSDAGDGDSGAAGGKGGSVDKDLDNDGQVAEVIECAGVKKSLCKGKAPYNKACKWKGGKCNNVVVSTASTAGGAGENAASTGSDKDDSGTTTIVVVVVVVLILAAVGCIVLYMMVQSNKNTGSALDVKSFENPMYATNQEPSYVAPAPGGQSAEPFYNEIGQTSGYLDVQGSGINTQATSGYMDVGSQQQQPATTGWDNEDEDV